MSAVALPFAAVLFDMDGTLVDTEPMWQESERRLMSSFGLDWTEEDHAITLGGSTERVSRYMAERIAGAGHTVPDVPAIADDFLDQMLRQLLKEPPALQPGALRLLQGVRATGVPTALVSSSSRPLMDAILAAIGDRWFDVTVSADDVDRHKPDPLPYRRAAELLAVDPVGSVAIEDSPTGVESATVAGAYVVAVQHLAPIAPASRRWVVTSLDDVDVAGLAQRFVDG